VAFGYPPSSQEIGHDPRFFSPLTTFFAGIHLGWRLLIVAIFLGLALIGATYLEEFVWILLIAGLSVLAVVFVSIRYAGGRT
jgi:hypothetical protein